jgi:hypothetical protein
LGSIIGFFIGLMFVFILAAASRSSPFAAIASKLAKPRPRLL